MKCKLVENNLIEFIEGTLPPNQQSALTEHFLTCQKCRALFESVKVTYAIYEQNTKPQVPAYFYTRLEQKLIAKASKKSYLMRITPVVWQPIAVSFVIVVGIFIGISIGRQITISTTNINTTNKKDILNTYATEYYLDGSGEESLDNLVTNE